MLKEHEIAINRQAISYIWDFSQAVIEGVERIIFLYNPLEEIACDDECKIDTLRPYDYLLSRWPRKIRISPVTDPALEAVEKYEKIYQDILLVIKGL